MFGRLQTEPRTPAGVTWSPRFWPIVSSIRRHRIGAALLSSVLVAAIVAGSLVAVRSRAAAAYTTVPVARQDLSQTVTASGTVNPQNTVNVGTQVSGTISALYVDYNSHVRKGQILARIDPSQMQAQLQQAQASLAQAEAQAAAAANTAGGAQSAVTAARATSAAQAAAAQAAIASIAEAQANVSKAQSAADLAQQTVNRDNSLLSQGYIAQSQVDADKSNLIAAQSALQSAQAAVDQARAQASSSESQAQAGVAQSSQSGSQAAGSLDTAAASAAAVQSAQAIVQQDMLNVQRTVITSPVDGTVIARNVSVGETVAASLQTPTLFSIAQDLKKMEVDIAVGEPDIGNVKPGDKVTFSVLAYPNDTFTGIVSQVRENPTTVSNVVTYTVISLVNNPQGKLLPGMTANATVAVQTVKNALVVPAQALSWKPAGGVTHAHHAGAASASGTSAHAGASSPWGQLGAGAAGAAAAGGTGVIFVDANGKAKPVRVRIDLTTGTQAAVTPLRGMLNAGDSVIVSSGQTGARSSGGASAASSYHGGPGGVGGLGRALH